MQLKRHYLIIQESGDITPLDVILQESEPSSQRALNRAGSSVRTKETYKCEYLKIEVCSSLINLRAWELSLALVRVGLYLTGVQWSMTSQVDWSICLFFSSQEMSYSFASFYCYWISSFATSYQRTARVRTDEMQAQFSLPLV